jgi:hypothetical protein
MTWAFLRLDQPSVSGGVRLSPVGNG